LIVTFVRAQDLRKVEVLGQSPAVHFNLNGQKDYIKSHACHHGNHTPVWNFPYVFDLNGSEHSMHIEVVHQGLIGTAFIGKADVALQNVIRPGENWYRLVHDRDDSAGDICITSTWEPAGGQSAGAFSAAAPQVYQAPPPQVVYQAPPPMMQAPVYQVSPAAGIPAMMGLGMAMQSMMGAGQSQGLAKLLQSGQAQRIALQASSGFYVHAGEEHRVHTTGREINHQTTWHVTTHGEHIALRSHHGRYLAAYSDGRVVADRDMVSHNEKFFPEELGNGAIAFRTHHGTYVGADGEGPLVQRQNLGQHEQFRVTVL